MNFYFSEYSESQGAVKIMSAEIKIKEYPKRIFLLSSYPPETFFDDDDEKDFDKRRRRSKRSWNFIFPRPQSSCMKNDCVVGKMSM